MVCSFMVCSGREAWSLDVQSELQVTAVVQDLPVHFPPRLDRFNIHIWQDLDRFLFGLSDEESR